jgi:hypothetical protein
MKKLQNSSIIFLVFILITLILFAASCDAAPGSEPSSTTEPATAPETEGSRNTAAEAAASETTYEYTPASTGPTADISCILGYWEVETESLRYAANSLILLPNLHITGLGPSVVYAFYSVSGEPSPTPYRMEVWYTDVLITANIQNTSQSTPQTLEMHLDGVFAADMSSDSAGEVFYVPIAEETRIQVTDIWLNGEPITDGSIDISDWADPDHGQALLFECLGNGRLSLTDPTVGTPVYLSSTSPVTRVTN